ncbi:putative MFS family arabinose efflux permease [Serratia fonticola]|uniref:Putative MFS family arabinose efflux permease n=1 Tax=Serratia fonticola TaxID=47917 RepID=A0A542D1Z9_SERFO|nr:putative MFS family arabinose efflux permease [Serratia fonticola]TQI97101.1 putative MFS family arabinose efflux permease [Serratia fonticola]TVZ71597.1 putative MFS family arabinose efflux permease [Serratia fonticola]
MITDTHLHETHAPPPAYWSGVFAMTLCVFVLIASEFMPVSLLTPLAGDLQVSEGMAGQGIAISGAFAVFASLFISALAGNINRKTLLLGLTAIMGVSGVIIALAQNYVIYMIGRALIGVVVGGFWSMSAATAMRLVPSNKVPRALAIFNSGNALATVVAAPLGAYLGAVIGWRATFFCLMPMATIAFIWQWFSLPSLPVESRTDSKPFAIFMLFKRRIVLLGMLGIGLFFMGQFTLFTYVRPFLETVTHVNVSTVTLILLVVGVAGFIGTTLISLVLKRGFYRTLVIIPLLMAAIALLLIVFGHTTTAVIALLGCWGLIATAAPVGWWTWVPRTFPTNAEAGGGLMVAMIQLSIALGSTTGGLLFDHQGYEYTFIASALLLLISSGLIVMTAKAERSAH